LSCKQNPQQPTSFAIKTLENTKNISKTGRVPRHLEHFTQPTPHKLRQWTVEEDMSNILRLCTQHTPPIRWVVLFFDLFGGKEVPSGQLPNEDFEFRRVKSSQISFA
jgi:hypothetical protein